MPKASLPRRVAFSPKGPFLVRHSFRLAGRDYTEGEPFEIRNKAISVRVLRQLHNLGKIECASQSTGGVTETRGTASGMSAPDAPLNAAETPTEPDLDPDELSSLTLRELQDMAKGLGVAKRATKKGQIKEILG